MGATALGVAATYVFWRYLQNPTWRWAAAAGVMLGLAQLTKFSMLLLYAVWPFLWLVRLSLSVAESGWARRLRRRASPTASLIVALSVLMIDAGYLFEGVGIPLGQFEFGSRTLTRPVRPGSDAAAQPEPAARDASGSSA